MHCRALTETGDSGLAILAIGRRFARLAPLIWRGRRASGEMTGRRTSKAFAFAGLLLAGVLIAAPVSAADGVTACKAAGTPFATVEALGARDGATIRLADGREVRLAGVAAPGDMDGSPEMARQGTAALDALVAGRRVALHGSGSAADRYGRLLAQVTVEKTLLGNTWLQEALVLAGAVRVAPGAGAPDCAQPLLERERVARANRAGLWRDGGFALQKAGSIGPLLAAAGRFAIVEGTVRRVGEAGGTLYLDFGRRYNRDFSIIVPREVQAAFAASGVDLRALSGKPVRARGVLFERGGPAVELRVPAALELIGMDGA